MKRDPYDAILAKIMEQASEMLPEIREQSGTDSPIEELFYTALFYACKFGCTEIDFLQDAADDDAVARLQKGTNNASRLIIQTQKDVAGWRADFVIHYYDGGYGKPRRHEGRWAKLIVECDGHDFHERTKQQAARDRSRDRQAQNNDIPVLRFTGSEIWRDPWGCAMQVIEWVQKRW